MLGHSLCDNFAILGRFKRQILDCLNKFREHEMRKHIRMIDDELKRIRDNHIRVRAYFLWQEAGNPHDQSLDFWLQAEREYYQIHRPHRCQEQYSHSDHNN